MINHWLFITLVGTLFWASSNFVDKYILDKRTKGIFDYLFFSTITSWFFLVILLFFVGLPELTVYSLIPIFTGILLIASYGFYARALEQGDTSSLVILFMLIPVVTAVLAYVILGQTLSAKELLGFFVVLFGGIIISFERKRNLFAKGLGMILIAIFLWSVMYIVIDYGLTKMSFWDYFLLDTLGSGLAGIFLFLIPVMRRQIVTGLKTATVSKYLWFSGNNLLDLFGQISIKKALTIAPSVGLVTVVTQVQAFYALVIGILLTLFLPSIFKEDIAVRNLAKKFVGALIMFVGVYILSV
ncbi:MAG: DMT family transporter [Patescibacteria group bacterium]